MKNLLFYGSTNYGKKLSKSDNLKFIELDRHFNTYVMTLGNNNENIKHRYGNTFLRMLIELQTNLLCNLTN